MRATTAGATRIAMDVTALLGPVTGVGSMVRELTARLPAAGPAEIDWTGFVVSARGRRALTEQIPAGWTAHPLPYPARLAHRLWRSVDVPTVGGFDLVHGPNYVVPPAGTAARLVTVHDLTAWRYPEMVDSHSRFFPEHLDRAIAGGAHVHAVSRFVADELHNDIGVPAERVHVVRNGYAPPLAIGRADRSGDQKRGRRLVGGPYVLSVGTIEPRKDHVTLVEAMAEVWSELPELRLVVVGADGWGADALSDAIDRHSAADRVIRLGYVNARLRDQLLAGAELLAFPSVYEGFGLPVLEAMGAGVPVVSTTAGAIPEVAGDAALLVGPGDPAAMAAAITEVVGDDGLRATLRAAGANNVRRFSWDRAARDLLGVYRSLLGHRIEVGSGT